MLKAEQIPREAWDKICNAFDVKPSEAKAALAAAINAWPGIDYQVGRRWDNHPIEICARLPLTQESKK